MPNPAKFRLRRIDLAPDDHLPDRPFLSRSAAEKKAEKLFGKGWAREVEVYQYSTGTTKPMRERLKGKNPPTTYSLPAEDVAYVAELAQREGRSKSSVIREGIALVREKYGEG